MTIDGIDDARVELVWDPAWNQEMISRYPDTAVKRARFDHFLKEARGVDRKDIKTYFDLIEFEEGRLP